MPSSFLSPFSCKLLSRRGSILLSRTSPLCHAAGREKCLLPRGTSTKVTQSSRKWLERQHKDKYAKAARARNLPSRAIYKLEQIDTKAAALPSVNTSGKRSTSKQRTSSAIFAEGQCVIDLGASPGSWSLYASSIIRRTGTMIAVDMLPLQSTASAELSSIMTAKQFHFIQGDFRLPATKEKVLDRLMTATLPDKRESGQINETMRPHKADVIMSDMAANFTGDKATDALRTLNLCEDALLFAVGSVKYFSKDLCAGGTFPIDLPVLHHGGTFLCKYFSCGKHSEHDLMDAAKRNFAYVKSIKPPASRKESAELYLFARGFQLHKNK